MTVAGWSGASGARQATDPGAATAVVPGIAELGVVMQRAQALETAGGFKQAERLWREALRRRIALLGADSAELAPAYERLAGVVEAQGHWRAAEPMRARAVALFQTARPVDPGALGRALTRLSRNLTEQGRRKEAMAASLDALAVLSPRGERSVDAAWGYNSMGAVLAAYDRQIDAEPYYRAAADIRREMLGEQDVDTATSLNNLGVVLAKLGRVDEAVPLLRQAFAARDAANPVGDAAAETALNLGVALDGNGRSDDATAWLQKAAAIWRARGGTDGLDAVAADSALAMNMVHLGRAAEAAPVLRRVLAIRRARLGAHSAAVGDSLAAQAATLDALGRHRAALPLHDRALVILRAIAGALATADGLFNRAGCHRALGEAKAAKADYRLAYVMYYEALGAASPRTRAAEQGMNAIRIN